MPIKMPMLEKDEEPLGSVGDETDEGSMSYTKSDSSDSNTKSSSEGGSSTSDERRMRKMDKKLKRSSNTLPTDSESSGMSTAYSSASTSYVDSWE